MAEADVKPPNRDDNKLPDFLNKQMQYVLSKIDSSKDIKVRNVNNVIAVHSNNDFIVVAGEGVEDDSWLKKCRSVRHHHVSGSGVVLD